MWTEPVCAPQARRRALLACTLVLGLSLGACSSSAASAGSDPGASGGPALAASMAPGPSAAASAAPLEFEPIVLEGRGDRRVAFDVPAAAAALARVANRGSGVFRVTSILAGGSDGETLVDTSGDYAGLLLFDALAGQHSVAFDVRSGGTWTIRVEPVGLAHSWSGDVPLTGIGDDVALLEAPSDGTTAVRIEHPGQGPVRVLAYTSTGELDQLTDATGTVDETYDVPPGTICLEVRAVGRWTLSPA